ncbi:MAG: hypothetical protein Kow00121_22750 [Elainellaceae cyanobacterium]
MMSRSEVKQVELWRIIIDREILGRAKMKKLVDLFLPRVLVKPNLYAGTLYADTLCVSQD